MTNWYVGPGGSDVAAGTSWGARFLTIDKARSSVAAADNVYVGPGTYKEVSTLTVSGTVGNVINWIGDYTGANTDGVGGVVRWTGAAADEKTASRANVIIASSKNYNTFTGFLFDGTTGALVTLTSAQNFVFNKCGFYLPATGQNCISCAGASQLNLTIQNSFFLGSTGNPILFTEAADVAAAGHSVQNCLVIGGGSSILVTRVRGITVQNSVFMCNLLAGIRVGTEGSAGALHVTVNNCLFHSLTTALSGVALGDIVEDTNNIYGCTTARTNTNVGASSQAYLPDWDTRWLFQLLYAGAGPNSMNQVVSPFDLASYSALVNLAGTTPTTTDLRGTAVQGAQREWGAFEYDSTLKIKAGVPVSISPVRGNIG